MRRTRSCEVYVDGASRGNPGPAGIGVVFLDPSARPQGLAQDSGPRDAPAGLHGQSRPMWQLSRYIGETTNNVAEYLALIYALQEALQQGYTELTVKTDSELLARQISGVYRVKDAQLSLFHDLVRHLMQGFRRCDVTHVPRTENVIADRLAGQAVKTRLRVAP